MGQLEYSILLGILLRWMHAPAVHSDPGADFPHEASPFLEQDGSKPPGDQGVAVVDATTTAYLDLAGILDPAKEAAKLQKQEKEVRQAPRPLTRKRAWQYSCCWPSAGSSATAHATVEQQGSVHLTPAAVNANPAFEDTKRQGSKCAVQVDARLAAVVKRIGLPGYANTPANVREDDEAKHQALSAELEAVRQNLAAMTARLAE